MDIAREIEHKAGMHVEIPAPNPKKYWQRFDCPFCGKSRAAINYDREIFICHHAGCRVTIKPEFRESSRWVLHRFDAQIRQAVTNTRKAWGAWLNGEIKDLWQETRMKVLEYDDCGDLDKWEAKTEGDPNEMDRYVLQALNSDLSNWADKGVRAKRRESLSEPGEHDWRRSQVGDTYESVEDQSIWLSWPTLALRFRERLSNDEIAEHLGVSESTVKRRIARELADARQTYLEP